MGKCGNVGMWKWGNAGMRDQGKYEWKIAHHSLFTAHFNADDSMNVYI